MRGRRLGWKVALVALACALGSAHGPAGAGEDSDTWLELFAGTDADRAYQAVQKAVARNDPDLAGPLFDAALGSLYPHVAVAAGDALRKIGMPLAASPRFAALVRKAVKAKDVATRRNLARILGAWGLSDFDEPIALLCARGTGAEDEALMAAGALPATDAYPCARTLKVIEASLKSTSPDVRFAACVAIGRRKAKSLLPSLLRLATVERVREVGMAAVRAIERLGEPVGAKPFEDMLRGKLSSETRDTALKALTTLSSPKDAGLLLGLLAGTEAEARRAAAVAVGRLAAPEKFFVGTRPSLATLPLDERRALGLALVDLIQKEPRSPVRLSAARSLGRMDSETAQQIADPLTTLIAAKDAVTSCCAMRACARLRLASAKGRVWEVLFDGPSEGIRAEAARALETIDPSAATRSLLERLGKTNKTPALHRTLDALGYCRTENALDGLLDALRTETVSGSDLERWEIAMERLTGHRFGRDAAAWTAWRTASTAPLLPPLPRLERRARRAEMSAQSADGLRPGTEFALERALSWLDRCQHAVGSWTPREDDWGGVPSQGPTYAALCLMAFAGAGHRASEGRYRETIWRAAEYLASVQRYDGTMPVLIGQYGGGPPRIRGLSAFVLPVCAMGAMDALSSSGDPAWRGLAQAALDGYADVQIPGTGFSRHDGEDEASTSATALAVQAFVLGIAEGLDVDAQALDGCDVFLRECTNDVPRNTDERPADWSAAPSASVGGGQTHRMFVLDERMPEPMRKERTASNSLTISEAAAAARFLMGPSRSHPLMVGFANTLLDGLPKWMDRPANNNVTWPWPYLWLGSLAAHQAGGSLWRTWGDRIATQFVSNQRLDEPALFGSWDSDVRGDDHGRLFATAISALTLETWYRLPRRAPR